MEFSKGDKVIIKQDSNVFGGLKKSKCEVVSQTSDEQLINVKFLEIPGGIENLPDNLKRVVNKPSVQLNVNNLRKAN